MLSRDVSVVGEYTTAGAGGVWWSPTVVTGTVGVSGVVGKYPAPVLRRYCDIAQLDGVAVDKFHILGWYCDWWAAAAVLLPSILAAACP